MPATLTDEMLIKLRETLRPIAHAIQRYDHEYPGHGDRWRFAGVIELDNGDLRAVVPLLAALDRLGGPVA